MTTTLRASVCSCASSSGDSSWPVNTTTGTSRSALSSADALQHLEPRHVGQPQVEHHAVERLLGQRGQRRRAGVGDHDVDVVVAEQLRDAQLLGGVVLDDQQPLAPRRRVGLDARERRLQPFGGRRLGDERERAARQAVLPVLVQRHDLHRDVPRVGVLLQLAEHRPAEHVGQEDVERDGRRLELARQRQRLGAAHRHQHLEALVVGQVDAGCGRSAGRPRRSAASDRPAARSSRSSSTTSIGRSGMRATGGEASAADCRDRAAVARRRPRLTTVGPT